MAFPRSGTVDTQTYSGTKDFAFARLNTTQSTNVANGDHLKFDTIDIARGGVGDASGAGAKSGGSISVDTTTTYATTIGAASIGRVTVQGGKVYKLTCNPSYALFSGATGVVSLQWFDVTSGSGTALGIPMQILPVTQTSNDNNGNGQLETFYSPGGSSADLFLLEVRILSPTALTSFASSTKGQATILVETY